jgi:hypothetical protein
MNQHSSIAEKINKRFSRMQDRLSKLLVKASSENHINILTDDIMTVSREKDFAAFGIILPKTVMLVEEPQDFAYAYLDLASMDGLEPGIYKIQAESNGNGGYLGRASLLTEDGEYVRALRFINQDPLATIAGPKNVPIKKNPVFEMFSKTADSYLIGGTLATGKGFMIAMDF